MGGDNGDSGDLFGYDYGGGVGGEEAAAAAAEVVVLEGWKRGGLGDTTATTAARAGRRSGGSSSGSLRSQSGHFSLVSTGAAVAPLSLAIAGRFPNATVLSLEGDAGLQEEHLAAVAHRNLWNNVLCAASTGSAVANKFYESPEFFRYQVVSANLLDTVLKATTTSSRGGSGGASYLGSLLSTGLTSFLHLPQRPTSA